MNICYQKISCNYFYYESIIHFDILLNKNSDIVPPLIKKNQFFGGIMNIQQNQVSFFFFVIFFIYL